MTQEYPFIKRPIIRFIHSLATLLLNNPIRKLLVIPGLLAVTGVVAGPEGGQIIGGNGSISQSSNTTTIDQNSQNMAIDWQSYDLNVDERVNYVQPNSSAISLNRILSNHGSQIHGRIDANGHVILVNPNGIIFGDNAVVNAGGILASGLSIDPSDFMNGDYTFAAIEGSHGVVINSGLLNASLGGSVALIGKEVENAGLISAQLGSVSLAAGNEAVVTFSAQGLVGVRVSEAILQEDIGVDPAVLNSGEIRAEEGQVLLSASVSQDIFSEAVNPGGMSHATSVVVHDDGSFTLGAGADVLNTGDINVSGEGAGNIVLIGENLTSSGDIKADAYSGDAGFIELHSSTTTILAENSQTTAISYAGGDGGDIKLLGTNVGVFDESRADVSGARNGGNLLVGGDQTGSNPLVRNADFIIIESGAQLNADGLGAGNGGRVIAFAGDSARIYGALSASHGDNGGVGGFVETSGLQGFEILLAPDVGSDGTWLIDPWDLEIISGGSSNNVSNELDNGIRTFTSTGATAELAWDTVEGFLDNGNRTAIIQTGGEDDVGGNGDIIFLTHALMDNPSGARTSTLRLIADGGIYTRDPEGSGSGFDVGVPSDSNDSLNIEFYAEGEIQLYNSTIRTNGGNFIVGGDHDSNGITPDILPTSFSAGSATINTSTSSDSRTGGDIIINTVRDSTTNGDVTLGALLFSGNSENGRDGGSITVYSGNDITIENGFDYHNTMSEDLDRVFSFNAHNDITINGGIYDSAGGEVDTLNIQLYANDDSLGQGSVYINDGIYTGGGNFEASGVNFDSVGVVIDTNNSNDGILVTNDVSESLSSNGGNVSLEFTAGNIDVGIVITDSNINLDPDSNDATGTFYAESTNFNLGFQDDEDISSVSSSSITTNGSVGSLEIYASGTVNIYDEIITNGGTLTIGGDHDGDSGASTADIIPTSVATYFAAAGLLDEERGLIDTSADTADGDITILSSGAINLGDFRIGDTDATTANNPSETTLMTVTSSGGAINLLGTIDYTSDDADYDSSVTLTGLGVTIGNHGVIDNTTGTNSLDLTLNGGTGDVVIAGSEISSGAPTGASFDTNIFLGGGDFVATGVDFTLGSDVGRSGSGNDVGQLDTQGGNVTIDVSGDVQLYSNEVGVAGEGTAAIITAGGDVTIGATTPAGSFDNYFSGAFGGTIDTATGAASSDDGNVAITTTSTSGLVLGQISLATGSTCGVDSDEACGDLSITTAGAIAQGEALTVNGALTLDTDQDDNDTRANVTLDNASNNFALVVVNEAQDVTLLDNGGGFVFGASSIFGDLNVTTTTSGNITQTAAISVTGTSTFDAVADIDLDDAANNFIGNVTLTALSGSASLRDDANGFQLEASTVSNDLTIDINDDGGADDDLTQNGVLSVGGLLRLDVDDDVVLDNGANSFVTVQIDNAGSVNIADVNDGFVLNTSNVSGDLTITLADADIDFDDDLTQTVSNNLTVGGLLTLDIDDDVVLAEVDNNLSSVQIDNANNVAIVDGEDGISFSTSTVSGFLDVVANEEAVDEGANDGITQTGVLTVAGTTTLAVADDIVLTQPGNNFAGEVTITSADNAALRDSLDGLVLADVTVTSDFSVQVDDDLDADTPADDTLTQTAGSAIDVHGNFTINVNDDVTLANANNDFSQIQVDAAQNVELVDADGGFVFATSAIFGSLAVTTADGGGDGDDNLTQTGAVSVVSTSMFNAVGDIDLDDQANNFIGDISVAAASNAAFRDDTDGLQFGNVSVTADLTAATSDSGDNDDITQAAGTTLSVGAQSTFSADDEIALDNSNNDFLDIRVTSGGAVSIADANGLAFNGGPSIIGGDLSVVVGGIGGSISQTGVGTLSVVGTTNLTANGDTISLTANNTFDGAVNTDTSGDAGELEGGTVTLNGGTITLGVVDTSADASGGAAAGGDINIDVTGNFSITATSVIDASGANTGVTGAMIVDGDTSVNVFTIDSPTTWSLTLATLNGDDAADVFNLNAAENIDAYAHSLSGSDTDSNEFNIGANISGSVVGSDGDDNFFLLTSGIQTAAGDLVGGGGIDTLTGFGDSTANIWASVGDGDGTLTRGIDIVNFQEIENLAGGTGVDEFTIAHTFNQMTGGNGDDIFTFNTGASLATTAEGNNDADTFNLNSDNLSLTIIGGEGITSDPPDLDLDTIVGFSDPGELDTDGNTWEITGGEAGNITNGGTVEFAQIEAIEGGDAVGAPATGGIDRFILNSIFDGSIDAGTGNDSLLVRSAGTTLINLGTSPGGISNIDLIHNDTGDAGGFILQLVAGTDTVNTWTIEGPNRGNVENQDGNEIAFIDFETLIGNQANDIFNFDSDTASILRVAGGDGEDSMDFTNRAGAVTVIVDENNDTALASNPFQASGIESITGRSGESNTLIHDSETGESIAWSLRSPTTGSSVMGGSTNLTSVTHFVNFTAGAGNDTFTIAENDADPSPDVNLTINGGGQQDVTGDTLIGFDTANIWNVNGENQGSIAFGDAGSVVFSDIENLSGSDTFADNFSFTSVDSRITGQVNAGSGPGDVVDLSGLSDERITAGTGSFGVIGAEELLGNSSLTLVGDLHYNTWRVYDLSDLTISSTADGDNDGTVTDGSDVIAFIDFGAIEGGDGDDVFTIDGSIDSIDGGGEIVGDRIDGRTSTSRWTLDAANSGGIVDTSGSSDVAYVDDFSGIEYLVGRSSDDELVGINQNNTWNIVSGTNSVFNSDAPVETIDFDGMNTLTGLSGADIFDFDADFVGTVNGGTGDDEFNINTTVSAALNGDGGDDDFDFAAAGATTGIIDGGIGGESDGDEIYGRALDSVWTLTGVGAGNVSSGVTYASSFVGMEAFIGRATSDELVALDQPNTWTIAAGDNRVVNTSDSSGVEFSGMDILTGQSGIDIFDFNADFVGEVNGGAGNDDFNINASVTATLNGGAGDDAFVYGAAGATTNAINGGDLAEVNGDSIQGRPSDSEWELTVANAGTVRDVSGAPTTYIASFTQIESLEGRAPSDELIGIDQNNTWTLDVTGNTVANTTATPNDVLAFVSMEVLTGGSGVDIFDFNIGFDGTVNGGADNDEFNINVSVAANLNGDAGDDDFIYGVTGATAGVIDGGSGSEADGDEVYGRAVDSVWTLTTVNAGNVEDVATGSNYVSSFRGIEALVGRAPSDELIGMDQGNTWTVTSAGNSVGTVDFSGMDILTGQSGIDIFNFSADFAGVVNGGADNDEFNINVSVAANLNGDAGDDDFIYGVAGATTGVIDGGSGGETEGDEVSGRAVDSVWTLTTANAGNVEDVATGTNYVSSFRGIEALVGRALSDELIGMDQGNTWELTSAGNSVGTVDFSGMDILTGQSGIDTFNFSGGFAGVVNGGANNDEFNIDVSVAANLNGDAGDDDFIYGLAGATTGVIDGGSGGETEGDEVYGRAVDSVWTLTTANAGNAEDVVTGTNYVSSFRGIEALVGRAPSDELIGMDQGNTWTVTSAGNSVGTVDFSGMDILTGQSGIDIFNFSAGFAGVVNGGADNDEFNINVSVAANLNGDAGDDDFIYGVAGATTGVIDGGSGGEAEGDEVSGRVVDSVWTLTAANEGNVEDVSTDTNYVSSFRGIEALVGRAPSDELIAMDQGNTWELTSAGNSVGTVDFSGMDILTGQSGIDTFNFSAGFAGAVNGGGDNDEFNINASVTATLNGGAGDDTFVYGAAGATTNAINGGDLAEVNGDSIQGRPSDSEWELTAANAGTVQDVSGAPTSYIASFTQIESLEGRAPLDELIGIDQDNTWSLSATGNTVASTAIPSNVVGFVSMETLTGGSGVDIFDFNIGFDGTVNGGGNGDQFLIDVGVAATLNGDAGDDFFVYGDTGATTGEVTGGTGNETAGDQIEGRTTDSDWILTGANAGNVQDDAEIYIANFSEIENLLGRADTDELIGRDQANTWTLDVTGSVVANTAAGSDLLAFAGMEILTGQSGVDTFELGIDFGVVQGSAGSDIFTLTADAVNGEIYGGTRAVADPNGDQLVGSNNSNSWTLTASREGTMESGGGTVTFAQIATLTGGASDDELRALDQDNRWEISALGSGDVQEDGNSSDRVIFTGMEDLLGGTQEDQFVFLSDGEITGLIDGGEGTEATDAVVDTLDLTALAPGIIVELGPNAAVSAVPVAEQDRSGFTTVNVNNVETITAPGAEEATNWVAITHNNGVNWNFTASADDPNIIVNEGFVEEFDPVDNAVIANSAVTLSNFGSLQGGSGPETPIDIVPNGGTISGFYIAGTGEITVVFVNAGFGMIDLSDNVVGVIGNDDVLIRLYDGTSFFSADNDWLITGENSGLFEADTDFDGIADYSIPFSGVNQFEGGEGNDTFIFALDGSLVNGTINGGVGDNQIIINSDATEDFAFGVSELSTTSTTPSQFYPFTGVEPAFLVVQRAQDDTVTDIVGISSLTSDGSTQLALHSGLNGDYTWDVPVVGDILLSSGVDTLNASGVDVIIGGSANDTFNIDSLANISSEIDGGEGNDVLNLRDIDTSLNISLDPELTVGMDVNVPGIETLLLDADGNTLYGASFSNNWTLSSVNDGSVDYNNGAGVETLDYTNITHLVGGANDNIFDIAGVADLDGTVTEWGRITGGGAGTDSINVSAAVGLEFAIVTSSDPLNVDNTIDLVGIDNVNANAGQNNTLIARSDSDNAWNIGVENSVTALVDASHVNFTGFQNLTGGDQQDQFIFDNALVSGQVDGGAHTEGFEDSLIIQNQENVVLQIGNTVNGNVNIIGIETLAANGSGHELIADNANNNWQINSSGANTVTNRDAALQYDFSGFEHLTGGSANDDFVVNADTDLSNYGLIDGGVDTLDVTDTLDLTSQSNAITVSLDTAFVGADVYINRIENVSADNGNNDDVARNRIVAAIGTNVWTIDGENNGDINGVVFEGFADLTGNSGRDEFYLSDFGATADVDRVTGIIDGGDGNDLVDTQGISSDITVALDSSTSSADINAISVEDIAANTADRLVNTLIAPDAVNDWIIEGTNAGYVEQSGVRDFDFSGFANLIGGDLRDVFTFTGTDAVTGVLIGNGGSDLLDIEGLTVSVSVSLDAANDADINVDGIETLQAAGNGRELFGFNSGEVTWVIDGSDAGQITGPYTVDFAGFASITGGEGNDRFEFNRQGNVDDTISGVVSGGDGSDIVLLNGLADLSTVALGTENAGDLNLVDIETIDALAPNTYQLIGENTSNVWVIDGETTGSINSTITFSGFTDLLGGSADDMFTLARTGLVDPAVMVIDGGADPTGTSDDTLDISAQDRDLEVTLDGTYDADFFVSRLENISADDAFENTLVGAVTGNSWRITAVNSGSINTTAFSGFANHLGRAGDDIFTFTNTGSVSGFVDGGGHTLGDRVDMSELEVVRVVVGDTDTGFLNIEEYEGNNTDSVITGADAINIWTLSTGVNTGSIEDQNGVPVLGFIGFNVLEGGDLDDTFNLVGGAVDGEIRAGLGDDSITVTIASGLTGELIFQGEGGNDSVSVVGGSAATDASFGVDTNGNAGLEYTTEGVAGSYLVTYTDIDSVTDTSQSRLLTIGNQLGQADSFVIENNQFTLTGFSPVAYANKESVTVAGENIDTVSILGQVSVTDTFQIVNAQVDASADAEIEALTLALNGTLDVASLSNPLATDVQSLQLQNTNGAVYINEANTLNIAQMLGANGDINIVADNAITSSGDLSGSADVSIASINGDITLANDNNFTGGDVSLSSPGTVTFTNTTATQLGDITAQNFVLTVGGDVIDQGSINIAGLTTLNAGSDSVTFDGDNAFGTLNVIEAGSVLLRDIDDITVQGTADDEFDIQAGGAITVNGAITGSDIALTAAQTITIGSDLIAVNSIDVATNGILVNADITVSDNILGEAVVLDAGNGAVELQAGQIDARSTSGGAGDLIITANDFDQQVNVDIVAGNISITSNTNVDQRASITALDNIVINANGGAIEMFNGSLTQGIEVDLNAGGDVTIDTIIADVLRINGVNVNQVGASQTTGDVTITASGEFSVASTGSLVIDTGDLGLAANQVQLDGEVSLGAGTATITAGDSFVLASSLTAGSVDIDAENQIAMAGGSSISGTSDVGLTAGGSVGITAVSSTEGTVSLVSRDGAIEDNNGEARNVSAVSLVIDAETGVASAGSLLGTQVSNMFVENGTGFVGISNSGDVTVTGIRNTGDITLINETGSVIIADPADQVYQKDIDDSRVALGGINGGYTEGLVTIRIADGDLSVDATLAGPISTNNPDIIGESLDIDVNGQFATNGRAIVTYAQTDFFLNAQGGIFPINGFGEPPRNGVQTDADLIDASATGSVQEFLVDLDSAEEIDPAVFTEVRNYAYDNISILMPRDQRYEDEDEESQL